MSKLMKTARNIVVACAIVSVSGCAAIHTSISKKNLEVQTKVSTAVFVDAVKREDRTVYVDVRSSVMEFDRNAFREHITSEFVSNNNGYTLTDDPDSAQFHMNIFVLTLEQASASAAELALKQGYSSGKGGDILAGAAVGGLAGNSGKSALGGALLGGIMSTVGNALVKDVTFMLVADVQIKERAREGVLVRKDSEISAKVSDSGTSTQRVSEVLDQKEYRTRIVTTANKANLAMDEAQPLMFEKTAYAMSGFF